MNYVSVLRGYALDTYPRRIHVSRIKWAQNSELDTFRPKLDTSQAHLTHWCPTIPSRATPPVASDQPPPRRGRWRAAAPATAAMSPCDTASRWLHPALCLLQAAAIGNPTAATRRCARPPATELHLPAHRLQQSYAHPVACNKPLLPDDFYPSLPLFLNPNHWIRAARLPRSLFSCSVAWHCKTD
jgi:hypothetical protein